MFMRIKIQQSGSRHVTKGSVKSRKGSKQHGEVNCLF